MTLTDLAAAVLSSRAMERRATDPEAIAQRFGSQVGWRVRDEGGDCDHVVDSRDDALEAHAEAYDGCGGWVEVRIAPLYRVGDVEWVGEYESETLATPQHEPDCAEGLEHEWESPIEVVGGIESNPGVWGKGGGVVRTEVCAHCGCERTTDTWAQDSSGRQGLTEVTYETDSDRAASARGYYRGLGRDAADDLDDDEVRDGDESWLTGEGALAVEGYRERLAERQAELADADEEAA